MILLCPERTDDVAVLRREYERRADAYTVLVDPVVQRGAYEYLACLLARIRELEGYPAAYFCGLPPIRAPHI